MLRGDSGVTAFCSAGYNSVGSAGHSFLLLSHLLRPNFTLRLSPSLSLSLSLSAPVAAGDVWCRHSECVCLSGAVVRGGRGGAACLSYRVCGCRRASGHAWLSLFAARVGAVVVGLVVQP